MMQLIRRIGLSIMSLDPDLLKHMPKSDIKSQSFFWGLIIILTIIAIIYRLVKGYIMFFIVRKQDPELYKEYRADQRARMISSSIDRQTQQMQFDRSDVYTGGDYYRDTHGIDDGSHFY